jgi:hypothetical protein
VERMIAVTADAAFADRNNGTNGLFGMILVTVAWFAVGSGISGRPGRPSKVMRAMQADMAPPLDREWPSRPAKITICVVVFVLGMLAGAGLAMWVMPPS